MVWDKIAAVAADTGEPVIPSDAAIVATRQKAEKPCNKRRVKRDTARMTLKEFGGYAHHVIQSAGGLQCRGGGDDGHDDQHHINGYHSGLQTKAEDKDEHAYHAVDTEADRPYFRADEDHRQHDQQLRYNQKRCHIICFCNPAGSQRK